MLQFVYAIDFSKFLTNLKKMVAAEDLDRAISLCKNVSRTSLPYISMRALEAAETDPTTVRGTIEEEAIDFLPAIERRLNVLPAFTLLIMLVGVLGTIDSLWTAFQSVDVLDTAKKQATLAQGIATSLNPTAIGLVFGMLMLAGYYVLKGIAISLTDRIHHGVTVLTNLLVPQEMVAYAPVASGDGGGGGDAPERVAASDSAAAPDNASQGSQGNDEAFDDVSVEEIKDEEEII
jgi:biopolymer transport protein ExbB/TolQ